MSDPLLPMGHSSVMASRAPTAEGDLNFFPTPPWAARAGAEIIKDIDPDAKTVWECACGAGHMAYALEDYFSDVSATDINNYGYGWANVDFLADHASPNAFDFPDKIDWVISNPPFSDGEAFIRKGWAVARRGVAMLLRLQFIEGNGRHAMFTADCPLTVLAPFAERVPMVKGRWDPNASSATAYAWFIFYKLAIPGAPIVRIIPPGSKTRLTMPGDVLKFGAPPAAPLLNGAAA